MREEITNKVREIKRRFMTDDLNAVCAGLGIPVVSADLPAGINGLYFTLCGKPAILIDEKLPYFRYRYCLGHELGHALFHEGLNAAFLSESTQFVSRRFENEADWFAAEWILGDLVRTNDDTVTAETLSVTSGIPSDVVEKWIRWRFQSDAA